jgi:hypothetical protein
VTRWPEPVRRLLFVALVTFGAGAAVACGKKGPPLPPLRPVPDKPTAVSVIRRDGSVTLRYTTPIRNLDGSEPFTFDHIEIYAMTVLPGELSPNIKQLTDDKNKVAEVAHDLAWPKPKPAGAAPDASDDEEPKAVPLTFTEKVPVVPLVVKPAPPPVPTTPGVAPAPPVAPVGPQRIEQATRFYMIVPFATRTRRGQVSDFLPVALGPLPDPPKGAATKYDETTLTLSWTATPGLTYQVVGLSATPLTAAEFKRPVVFNKNACFVVRAARAAGPISFESAASEPACVKPVDTFAPAAPTGLVAFASEGSIDLTWEAPTASDLAGYLVLRTDGTGDKLQPLMTAPITGTAFKDTTAKTGVRYTYAVVAVDTAGNRSPESNRVEETGRTQR